MIHKRQILFLGVIIFSILVGNSYTILDSYDFQHGVDCEDYLKMATGDFDVSLVRRYRILVPALAGGLYRLVSMVLPSSNHAKALLGSFFIVNAILMTVASIFLVKLCLRHNVGVGAAFIAILAVISSRWSGYLVGHPYTDSLYLLLITLFFYYLHIPNPWLQFGLLVIGMMAKESFFMFLPLFFVFSKLNVGSRVFIVSLSLVGYFSFRYMMDTSLGVPMSASLSEDMGHTSILVESFWKIFSPFGMAILFAVHSFFNLLFLFDIPFAGKNILEVVKRMERPLWFLPPIILVHMLLSGTVDRMYFFIAPFFVVLLAVFLERSQLIGYVFGKSSK